MIANAIGNRVRIALAGEDPEVVEQRADELIDARHRFDAHALHFSTSELRPFEERLNAAEAEFDDLFSETLTIEQAERVHARLGRAIQSAKINRGDARIY